MRLEILRDGLVYGGKEKKFCPQGSERRGEIKRTRTREERKKKE